MKPCLLFFIMTLLLVSACSPEQVVETKSPKTITTPLVEIDEDTENMPSQTENTTAKQTKEEKDLNEVKRSRKYEYLLDLDTIKVEDCEKLALEFEERIKKVIEEEKQAEERLTARIKTATTAYRNLDIAGRVEYKSEEVRKEILSELEQEADEARDKQNDQEDIIKEAKKELYSLEKTEERVEYECRRLRAQDGRAGS
jgi:hypothetical protein